MTRKKTKNGNQMVKAARLNYSVPTKNGKGAIGGRNAYSQAELNQVCSLTDPFCPAARGSRIPDDDSSPSLGIQVRERVNLATDGTGAAAITFYPGLQPSWKSYTAMGTGEVTTWGASQDVTDWTKLSEAGSQYRMVSWGVRMYPVVAPTEQGGYFHVITTSENTDTNGFAFTSSFFPETKVYPISEKTVHWVSRPQGTTWKEYVPMEDFVDYTRCTVVIQGAQASSTVMAFEIVYNLEVVPQLGQLIGAVAKPGQPHNPKALSAASHVYAMVPSSVKNYGSGVLRRFADFAMRKVANYFLPGSGMMLPAIKDEHIPEVD